MRVAYASDDLGPHDRRLLLAAASGKSPHSHEVHLLTFFNRAERLPDWIARECSSVRVHHRRFPAYPEVPSASGRLATALARRRDEKRYLAAFAAALREIRPDLVHAGWLQSTGYAAARAGFRPIFLMPWGSDVLFWPARSRRDLRKARIALGAAAAVACDAEAVRRRIVEISGLDPAQVDVFPWGVDLERFRPGPSALRTRLGWGKDPVVVMTRQMRPVYGVLEFARGFGALRRRVPAVRLLLAGGGELSIGVAEALRPFGPDAHMAGEVGEEGMAEILRAGDVYVSHARSDGTSVSLLEAMASGLPAVVTDLPANREWVEEGISGFLVPWGDLEGFADRIARLLADPALRRCMGEKALESARARADWRVNAARMLAGWDRAAGRDRVSERA